MGKAHQSVSRKEQELSLVYQFENNTFVHFTNTNSSQLKLISQQYSDYSQLSNCMI